MLDNRDRFNRVAFPGEPLPMTDLLTMRDFTAVDTFLLFNLSLKLYLLSSIFKMHADCGSSGDVMYIGC